MNGVKLVRGYAEPGKAKEEKKPTTPTTATFPDGELNPDDEGTPKALKRKSAPVSVPTESGATRSDEDAVQSSTKAVGAELKDKFSSALGASGTEASKDEAVRKLEEQEIRDDYTGQDGEKQGREIEHLVLVTHGIGQMLSMRYVTVFALLMKH